MNLNGFYTDNVKKGMGLLVEVLKRIGSDRYMVMMMHESSGLSDPDTPAPLSVTPEPENVGQLVVEVGGQRLYVGDGVEVKLFYERDEVNDG